jgi:uncharacterized protein (DUF1501 family)
MQSSRRGFLLGSAATLSLGGTSLQVRAAETDSRFVLVFLRGALDGLDAVPPYGDPNLKVWRPSLVLPDPGRPNGLADLGGFWGLHPALKTMHALYVSNDMLPVHCVAGPDRSRSHFQGEDMMEIGAETRMTSGWLNRLAALLPANSHCDVAFALGGMPPLVLHGPTPTTTWDPFQSRPRVSPGFYDNVVAMHANDPQTGPELADGLRERRYIDGVVSGTSYNGIANGFPRLARVAAKLLAAPDGPRLAELDLGGWDTHFGQRSRMPEPLGTLDEGIAVLRAGLADVWSKTAILVLTEFGRTVRVNGSSGTDHGTGTVAFLIGGAVAGGRVLANWPGLAAGQLFENRDLQPTLDIRALAKGLIGPHFGISAAGLKTVFPNSDTVIPKAGLLKV